MRYYGTQKNICLVNDVYTGSECAIADGTGITERLIVRSGVKRGCTMSGFLFLLVIGWLMRSTISSNDTSKLVDLDYTDDIVLLSSTKDQ